MSCKDLHSVVSASVDGEAEPAERDALEQHLESCVACRERVASLRALKHGISKLEARTRPPEAVFARMEALRFRLEPSRWRRFSVSVWSTAIAAAVVLAVVAARWFFEDSAASLADELIADHMKYVPEAMPAEVASNEPADVRRFFEGKVPFEPIAPSLDGAKLIGGRLCRIRGYYEQLLFYERGGRKLSLYVSDRPDASSRCEGNHGYHVCGLRRGPLSLRLVGDAPETELRSLLDNARL